MIIRILTEGQYEIPDGALDDLNALDDRLGAAVEANDEEQFRSAVQELASAVRGRGTRLADDDLRPSECVVPSDDTEMEDVRALLNDEGLIPG